MQKSFLHVGCGKHKKNNTTLTFASDDWREIRLDIDAKVEPDIVASMLDMNVIADSSMDAIFSSHNLEHLYPHEVPIALAEFWRVLKPEGFAVVSCPDLQSIGQFLVSNQLTDTIYQSAAGPISPLDILYGHRQSIAEGSIYMAHHCGFTDKVLVDTLITARFASIACMRRRSYFELWALATKQARADSDMQQLASMHFPQA